MSHQGASGVLNEDIQGDDRGQSPCLTRFQTLMSRVASWADHARDLLLMINYFREQMPRPMVGIGHSMGCTTL